MKRHILTLIFVAALFPYSSEAAVFTRNLAQGMSGAEVRSLQEYLRETGDFTYPEITGYYGPATVSAVQRFQCTAGIVCSGSPASTGYGMVGSQTRAVLNKQSAGGSTPNILSILSAGGSVNFQNYTRAQLLTFVQQLQQLVSQQTSDGSDGSSVSGGSSGGGSNSGGESSSGDASSNATRESRKYGPHFNMVWIEPAALIPSVGLIEKKIDRQTLEEYIERFYERGVDTLVLAYSEFIGCTYYDSNLNLPFYRYYQPDPEVNVWDNALVNPKDVYCPPVSDGNFYDILFEKTEELGMDIIVGLGRSGDWVLMEDIYSNLIGTEQQIKVDVNDRLEQTVIVSNAMANELYDMYGKYESFRGWYLAHETSCIDIGANYYNQVGSHLRSIDSSLEIVISPPATLKNCYTGQSVRSELALMPIDTVMVQDAVGAGFDLGAGTYKWTDTARKNRIAAAKNELPALKKLVESAGKNFIINTEGWEMNGECNGESNYYGCAYPGDFSSRVQSQLDGYWSITHELMLNPSFQILDFGDDDGVDWGSSSNENAAQEFAREYTEYLDSN